MVSQYYYQSIAASNSAEKTYLFSLVPFYIHTRESTISISLLFLSQLKFSLLLTQIEEAKILVHYTVGALTCNIRPMMKADFKHSGFRSRYLLGY